jgi:hypothetical protein
VAIAAYLLFTFRYTPLGLAIPLLLISDKLVLLNRPEPVGLFCILGLHYLWYRNKKNTKLWLIAGTALLAAIHLPTGILSLAAILCYYKLLFKFETKYYVLAVAGTLVLVMVCYFFPTNVYVTIFLDRLHILSIDLFLKFLMFSGVTLVALLYTIRKHIDKTLVINLVTLLLLCTVLGGYYYFTYLFIPLILLLKEYKFTTKPSLFLLAAIAFNVVANVVHPIFTQVENQAYCKQVNSVAREVYKIESDILKESRSTQLFVENEFGPGAFTQGNNCRMLLYDPERLQVFGEIQKGDKVVIVSPTKLSRFLDYSKINYDSETFTIEQILNPVPGKLSLQSLYTKRTDSLGLWVLTKR